jgi:hypothetical protein
MIRRLPSLQWKRAFRRVQGGSEQGGRGHKQNSPEWYSTGARQPGVAALYPDAFPAIYGRRGADLKFIVRLRGARYKLAPKLGVGFQWGKNVLAQERRQCI